MVIVQTMVIALLDGSLWCGVKKGTGAWKKDWLQGRTLPPVPPPVPAGRLKGAVFRQIRHFLSSKAPAWTRAMTLVHLLTILRVMIASDAGAAGLLSGFFNKIAPPPPGGNGCHLQAGGLGIFRPQADRGRPLGPQALKPKTWGW